MTDSYLALLTSSCHRYTRLAMTKPISTPAHEHGTCTLALNNRQLHPRSYVTQSYSLFQPYNFLQFTCVPCSDHQHQPPQYIQPYNLAVSVPLTKPQSTLISTEPHQQQPHPSSNCACIVFCAATVCACATAVECLHDVP